MVVNEVLPVWAAVLGHFRKRGQAWQVIVTMPRDAETSRCRQVSRTTPTKREAEEVLARLLHEVDQGHHGGPDVTVAELLERFYAMARPTGRPRPHSSWATAPTSFPTSRAAVPRGVPTG